MDTRTKAMRMTTVLIAGAALLLGAPLASAEDPKAEAVLRSARRALGGEDPVRALKEIKGTGKHRRTLGETQVSGETTITATFPDTYLRSQTDQVFGDSITIEAGFTGDEPVQRSRSSGGGPGVVLRIGGPEQQGNASDPEAIKAAQLRSQRAELTRLTLGWLATAPAFMEATYTYAGEAESPDGRADVIEVRGRDAFAARLFLDQQTHRPLMVTYMGAPRVMRMVRGGPPENRPRGSRPTGQVAPGPEREIGRQESPAHGGPRLVEIQLFFEEYRKVGDVWLPHRISRSVDGQTHEEIEFEKIQVR